MIQVAIDDAELKAMHRPRLATKKPLGGRGARANARRKTRRDRHRLVMPVDKLSE
ncbi:hypothetical protein ACFQBU_03845 [Jhaorihella thermophila]